MNVPPIAAVGALIGDPARALMLSVLMDGRTRTASELASEAGITRQTASAHLAKLTDRGLLALERRGRHRYFRLNGSDVASVLESLMLLGDRGAWKIEHPASPEQDARTCYDHLAGRLGVALLDSLCAGGYLEVAGSQVTLSSSGEALFEKLAIDLKILERRRRAFARMCLDWSERRNHLAGSLGQALLEYFLEHDWIRRQRDSRAVTVTPKGQEGFGEIFGIPSTAMTSTRTGRSGSQRFQQVS